MIWCILGIVAGVFFGVIPGAGPFLAVATFYPFLLYCDPVDILTFYILSRHCYILPSQRIVDFTFLYLAAALFETACQI